MLAQKNRLNSVIFALVMCCTQSSAQDASIPNFAPSSDVGWVSYGPEFIPPPSGPGPVASDPTHPFIGNPGEYFGGRRPGAKSPEHAQFAVADLSNPILQPWAREELRRLNEHVLSGKPLFEPRIRCWPAGIPAFNLIPVGAMHVIQTPSMVVMLFSGGELMRHIYLNEPHTANLKPSWNGESVGHYEGDTLVVDTIGMNDRTFVDNFRTPHTTRMHVIERFRLLEGGTLLEVNITVDDPGAFTTPWKAIQRFQRRDATDGRGVRLFEFVCAENNANYFNLEVDPIATADTPDF